MIIAFKAPCSFFASLKLFDHVLSGGWLLPGVSFATPREIGISTLKVSFKVRKLEEERHRLESFTANFSKFSGQKLLAAEELYQAEKPYEKFALMAFGGMKEASDRSVNILVQLYGDGQPTHPAQYHEQILSELCFGL